MKHYIKKFAAGVLACSLFVTATPVSLNAAKTKTKTTTIKPGKVKKLSITSELNGDKAKVTFKWKAAPRAKGYIITYRSGDKDFRIYKGNNTTASVDLLQDTTYTFSVKAFLKKSGKLVYGETVNKTITTVKEEVPAVTPSAESLLNKLGGADVAVATGDVVTLLQDITLPVNSPITLDSEEVVLDLNGHAIIYGSQSKEDNAILLQGPVKLTIQDSAGGGKIAAGYSYEMDAFAPSIKGDKKSDYTLTLNGGSYERIDMYTGSLVINNAKINGHIYTEANTNVTITGGQIEGIRFRPVGKQVKVKICGGTFGKMSIWVPDEEAFKNHDYDIEISNVVITKNNDWMDIMTLVINKPTTLNSLKPDDIKAFLAEGSTITYDGTVSLVESWGNKYDVIGYGKKVVIS